MTDRYTWASCDGTNKCEMFDDRHGFTIPVAIILNSHIATELCKTLNGLVVLERHEEFFKDDCRAGASNG